MNTKSILYTHGIATMLIVVLFQLNLQAQVAFAGTATPSFLSGTEMVTNAGTSPYSGLERTVSANPVVPAIVRDPDYMGDIGLINYIVNERNNAANVSSIRIGSAKIFFRKNNFSYPFNPNREVGLTEFTEEQLLPYALAAKHYAITNGFDTTYAFLVNMGVMSDRKRFFVVNLSTMEIEASGLAAQGRGQGPTRFSRQYSNIPESKCTSLGRYRIMGKYAGEYGNAYRLTGLDSSNSNAAKRNIVLHAMGCLPDIEMPNSPVCITEGCPGVSVNFLNNTLAGIIDSRKKPLLMWMFDSNLEDVTIEREPNMVIPPAIEEILLPRHQCALHHQSGDHLGSF